MNKRLWCYFAFVLIVCSPLAAQDATPVPGPLAPRSLGFAGSGIDGDLGRGTLEKLSAPASGNRWLLLCCGLPGDETHREKLTKAAQQIMSASETVFQVAPAHLRVLVGDDVMLDAIKGASTSVEPEMVVCTRDSVADCLQTLASQIASNDSLWIVFLGHAQLYGGRSTFNVQGKDFDATEFAKWLAPIQCRDRVLFLTMPVSGFWIKPLRSPGTVVISATDADFEFTGTEMPYALANVVSGNSEQALEDIDQDGSISLLDLYLAANIEVHTVFKGLERLQTEHAQIDDNGDGVGRELQEEYLPTDAEEGEVTAKPVKARRPLTTRGEGDFARTLKLGKPNLVPRDIPAEE